MEAEVAVAAAAVAAGAPAQPRHRPAGLCYIAYAAAADQARDEERETPRRARGSRGKPAAARQEGSRSHSL